MKFEFHATIANTKEEKKDATLELPINFQLVAVEMIADYLG